LAFATPVAAWAVGLRSPSKMNAAFRFVLMPMYMFSGTFFALDQLPHWLRVAASVLPLTQGVELCRSLSLGSATTLEVLGRGSYLLALALGGIAAARLTYRRRLHP
ncbi:MAG TPA: ABC transporter permease, partial [Gaiellaceae bacterium]|nr:ABC transporter permease [Gaiellaceae bacterium]